MTEHSPRVVTVRVEADTLEHALALAAEQLGVEPPEAGGAGLQHHVEQVGSRGLLGLGRKPFVVTASTTVGAIGYRATKSGIFLRIAPPLTLTQASRALAERGAQVDPGLLGRVLAARPSGWVRIGIGDPAAPLCTASLTIAADEMSASLTLGPMPKGGRTFDADELVAFVRAQGVKRGISQEALAHALEGEHTGQPIVVAKGEPAHHGADATLRLHFRTDTSHVALREDEHGHIDFHEVGLFVDVASGSVLVDKTPNEPAGPPGFTITDKPLPARAGVDEVTLKAGKNTVLAPDGLSVLAAIAGQVVTERGVVSITAVHEIRGNVDFSTGNIDSHGSVVIRGDVAAGFHVRAEGNIDVYGLVESAQLSAKGDVVIRKGIFGHDVGTIEAGGDVLAKFADRTRIRAGRDVVIAGEIMTSDIEAGRRVKCEGAHSCIIGGHIRAADTVSAATIGSRLGVATAVSAGTAVIGTKVVFGSVRLTVGDSNLEVMDAERAARFVEENGAVVRAPL